MCTSSCLELYARDTGWFQPSTLFGTWSPSTHRLTSSHHGVLVLHILPPSLVSVSSMSIQRLHLRDIREPIQSIVLPARCSSSSCTAFSISTTSENLTANEACGTDVSDVVRVVTEMRFNNAFLGPEVDTHFVVGAKNIARSPEVRVGQLC